MSLAARVAAAIATISILTAVFVTGSAIVSTSSGVRNDVDQFLRGRAEEIVDGSRLQPERGRLGRRIIIDQEVDPGDPEDLADIVELNLPDAFDVDAEVQTLNANGQVNASTGLEIPVSAEALRVAQRSTTTFSKPSRSTNCDTGSSRRDFLDRGRSRSRHHSKARPHWLGHCAIGCFSSEPSLH